MKKLIIVLALALVATANADAQFLNRLVKSATNAAKDAVERNVDKKIEEGVDKSFEKKDNNKKNDKSVSGWTCPSCGHGGNTGKFCTECGTKQPEPSDGTWTCPSCGTKGNTGKFCNECGAKRPDGSSATATVTEKKTTTTEYAKCDFVPGDEVFFDDPVEGEQVGEFPSKWDMISGSSEIAVLNGEQVITIVEPTRILPLMKDARNFLGDAFTLELDFWGTELQGSDYAEYLLNFESGDYGIKMFVYSSSTSYEVWWHNNSTGNWANASGEIPNININGWNHLAVSFNKRALKVYINGTRVASAPNVKPSTWFNIGNELWKSHGYIKNIRLAKGAVPLYDRLASEGKIVTYAITFETGKADLKPESMVEIIRIAKLMNNDASLNFEVQGHCDNTGSDKVNDPLSQKRAEAIVNALVAQGIKSSRLTAVGKGSHNPIADNATEEGRAKNRRVEFIKK